MKAKLILGGAIFHNAVNISKTIIDEDVFFNDTIFNKEVDIVGSQFNGLISFARTQFMREAVFIGTRFIKSALFSNSEFILQARFDDAQFDLDAHFEATRFESAYFNGARFNKDVNFRWSTFERSAEIKEARFDRDVYFIGAKFEENINFNNSEFHSDVYFNDVAFKGSVDLSKSQFNNRLFLPWNILEGHLAYDGSAYLFLVKNYNNLEKFDDADKCYLKYRILRRRTLNFRQKLLDIVPFLALGYGVYPEYPLILGGLLILIFACFYTLVNPEYSLQNAAILSAAIFATQTKMESFNGLNYILSIIEGFLGIILMACFTVTLAKKTLR